LTIHEKLDREQNVQECDATKDERC
jgi:hypothetical protein